MQTMQKQEDIEHVLEWCEETGENGVKWNEQIEEWRKRITKIKRIT